MAAADPASERAESMLSSEQSEQPEGGDAAGGRADATVVGSAPMPDVTGSMKEIADRMKQEWNTRFLFYGKVIDEREESVAGADVMFLWSDLSPSGTSRAHTTSDQHGLFAFVGERGRGLSVQVSKPGYYTQRKGVRFNFDIAEDDAPQGSEGSKDQPAVFRLRKRGPGTALVSSQHGIRSHLAVGFPMDGAPVKVDLLRRAVGDGPLELRQVKPDFSDAHPGSDWSFRMEMESGGFLEHDDEFPHEAPEGGYTPVIECVFRAGQADWSPVLRR